MFYKIKTTDPPSLDLSIRSSSYITFKKHLINKFKPVPKSMFNIPNPVGILEVSAFFVTNCHANFKCRGCQGDFVT